MSVFMAQSYASAVPSRNRRSAGRRGPSGRQEQIGERQATRTKPLARRPLRVRVDASSCPQRFILGYNILAVCDPYALHEERL